MPEFLRERMAKKDFINNHELLAVGTRYKKVFDQVVKAHGKLPKKTSDAQTNGGRNIKILYQCFC